jgi:outer membrane protein TolC
MYIYQTTSSNTPAMNKKYNLKIGISFLIISIYFNLFQSISVFSQNDSLLNYLEIAAKNNPTVLQRFYEYQASLQKVPQVGSLPDPELNVGIFLTPMELIGGNQVAEFQLMQMFPWFGVLKNSKDEMSLMAKAKYESFRDARFQVFYDVQRTWYELHKFRHNIRISERNAEILRTLERLALVKYKTVSAGTGSSSSSAASAGITTQSSSSGSGGGMGTMGGGSNAPSSSTPQQSAPMQSSSMGTSSGSGLADLYRIQIEIGNLENSIALLISQQKTITARFNAYLNRPVNSVVFLSDSLKSDSLQVSILSVFDSIMTKNPMLTMLQYEQESLEARKKMVTRMGYPMVGLGINYTLINQNEMSTSPMNGEDMLMPMVKITVPIYRKKYQAQQAEAELMKTATNQGYTATANSLQTEYYEAIQAFQDAERRMKLFETQSMLANKSLNIMVKSFSASSSGSGLTDILSIRQQTLDYEFKKVEALVDYNSAIAWLKRLYASI